MCSLFMGAVYAAPIVGAVPELNPVQVLKVTTVVAFLGGAVTYCLKQAGYSTNLSGKLFMAVQVELWQDVIMKNLFKDNTFLNQAYNADQYVIGGSVVHIPQAGSKPSITKNPSSFPLTPVLRADGDVTYALDIYASTPTHIPKAELMEISYDKMASVLEEHLEAILENMCDEMLYKWGAESASKILRTTGGAVAAHLPSATGNRKLFLKEDLKKAQFTMNKSNVPKADRFAIFSSSLLEQLHDDADLKKRDKALELDMKNGTIDRLYGFQIFERSDTLIYTNAGTPVRKAVGAAAAATDNDSVICWQKNAVERAVGDVFFFEDLQNPLYLGDIYNALVKMGGRKRRTNGEGIVSIVQDASA